MRKLCIGVLALLASAFAIADEDIKWSGSVKVWNASASIYGWSNDRYYDTYSNASGNISLTAKKKDWLFVASTLLPTGYSVDYSSTVGGYLRRQDYDLAVGYSLLPNVSPLVGIKVVDYKVDGSSPQTLTAPYIGLTGSQLLSDKYFLYGTVIYAPNATDSTVTTSERPDKRTFLSYELGFGMPITGTTQLTFGYRAQDYASRHASRQIWYSDTIRGVIFGVNHNF